MNKYLMLFVSCEEDWIIIQAKAFACGFGWINSGNELKHYNTFGTISPKPIFFQFGIMFTGVEESDKYTMITITDFMLGNLPANVLETNKTKLEPIYNLYNKPMVKYMCVMNSNIRVEYGEINCNEPMLMISDMLYDGGKQLVYINHYLEEGYTLISVAQFMLMFPPVENITFLGYEVKHIEGSNTVTIGCETLKISSLRTCAEVLDLFFSKTNSISITENTLRDLNHLLKKLNKKNEK